MRTVFAVFLLLSVMSAGATSDEISRQQQLTEVKRLGEQVSQLQRELLELKKAQGRSESENAAMQRQLTGLQQRPDADPGKWS